MMREKDVVADMAMKEQLSKERPEPSDQSVVNGPIFVLVRSSDIRGCVDVRSFRTMEAAKDHCVVRHKLPHFAWEPYLTVRCPKGPLTMGEAGETYKARYVGWQQEAHDGSMMQIFEQHIRP